MPIRKTQLPALALVFSLALLAACNRGGSNAPVQGQEQAPQFKAGFNLLSPQQDIEIGRQNARQVEHEMRVLPDPAPLVVVERTALRGRLTTTEPRVADPRIAVARFLARETGELRVDASGSSSTRRANTFN